MLVLPDPHRFRVDLHKLRERILQTPRDRHGAAQGHIKIGEFLRTQPGGGINRRPRLVDHHIGQPAVHFPDQFGRENFRFLRGRSVADREHVHPMPADERGQLRFGFFHPVLGRRGINDSRVEHLPGRVDHRNLAAGAVSGIDREHGFPFYGRLHQQGF